MSSSPDLRSFCDHLARVGGGVARTHFDRLRTGGPLAIAAKADRSPVTEADHASQAAMIAEIRRAFPAATIIGEEEQAPAPTSAAAPASDLCFILDPIDGTRNFMTGLPLWCVCVAALRHSVPVAAAIFSPADDVLWSAAAGAGTTRNGQPVRASPAPLQRNSLMACPSPQDGRVPDFSVRWQSHHTPRNLGSAGLHLALVAEGTFTAAAGPECKLWDVAAGWLLVEQAGGRCTTLDGRPLFPFDLASYAGQTVPWVAAGAAFAEVLPHVRPPAPALEAPNVGLCEFI